MKMIRKTIGSTVGLLATMLILSIAASGTSVRAADTISDEMAANGVLRVSSQDLGKTKNVRIISGKALILELPAEIRDVLIANPKTMDAVIHTSTRVYLIAKKLGQTNVIFFAADGTRILTLNISVRSDGGTKEFGGFGGLEETLQKLFPGAHVNIRKVGYTIILTGSVRTPAEATNVSTVSQGFFEEYGEKIWASGSGKFRAENIRIINMLSVEGKEQVMLKVRIAEMNRTVMKQLGINLGAAINSGNLVTSLLTENALPLTAAAGLGALPVPGIETATQTLGVWNAGPSAGVFGNSGIQGTIGGGNSKVAYAVRALERNGLIHTLAEPTLTAISGESAEFLAGGEIPYVTFVDPQTGKSAVEFKKFGVQLAFKPIVLSEGRISLKIDTGVSEIQSFIAGNPVFGKRQTKTTVELPSGGSMVLSGLISRETRQNMDGLPGLKNLPVLGALFRSRDFITKETELVVIVTPYIVKPVSAKKLITPNVGFAAASDAKANLLGHMNRVYGRKPRLPRGRQHGNYGFIVE